MTTSMLVTFLAVAALKSSVILALGGLVTVAWKSASAAAKHLVWTVAVAAALLVPAIDSGIRQLDAPRIAIPVLSHEAAVIAPSPMWPATVESSAPLLPEAHLTNQPIATETTADEKKYASPSMIQPEVATAEPAVRPREIDWSAMLFPLWLAGALIALIPIAIARLRIRLLAKQSTHATNGMWIELLRSTPSIAHLAGRIRVLESGETRMPMTWGIVSPTLLVPASSREWPEWRRREILLHELAHIDRRDCLTQLIAQAACALYWFNPLTWYASHRMRVERELACDDRVINAGARATDYASNLIEVARSLKAPSLTSSSAIAMARPSQLSGRLLAVLDPRRNRRSVTGRIAGVTSSAAVVLTLAVASLTTASAATLKTENPPSASSIIDEPVTAAVGTSEVATSFVKIPIAIVRAAQLPGVGLMSQNAADRLTLRNPLTTVPLPVIQSPVDPCWTDGDKMRNTSISGDDDGNRASYTISISGGGCSFDLRAEGKFTLRPDLSDVESISDNGWVRMEEHDGSATRRVEMRRSSNGSIDHQYWINGNRASFDNDARAWLARTLLAVERRTAFTADTRVPQLYKSGGLQRVLSEIGSMQSAYPKSKYYSVLLDMGVTLDASTLNGIVRQVGTDLTSSDYYMAEVLGRFAKQSAANETTWQLFAEAAGRMKSDYYKSEILKKVLSSGRLSSATVATLLKSASSIKSDYSLTEVLKAVASKYTIDASTRPYYVDAIRHIESDYYRGELLKTVGSEGEWDSRTSAFVLESVANIKSDFYKSESLVSLLKNKHVQDWPAFFSATASIGSDYYKKTTLTSVLREAPLDRSIVAGVLSAASRIKSDSEMADVLTATARSYRIDESLRPAFEKAVDSMESDYYRGAALSALRRSMARS